MCFYRSPGGNVIKGRGGVKENLEQLFYPPWELVNFPTHKLHKIHLNLQSPQEDVWNKLSLKKSKDYFDQEND